jgi:signal transduction histidine kinase
MNYFNFLIPFFVALANVIFGFFVWRHNPGRITNVLFGLFAFFTGCWALSIHATIAFSGNLILGRLGFSFVIIMAALLALFVYAFPEKKEISLKISIALLSLPLLFLALSFTDLLVRTVEVGSGHINGEFGPAFIFYRLFILLYSAMIIAILLKKYFSSDKQSKLRLKYLFLGILFFMLPTLFTNVILSMYFGNHSYNSLGPLFSVIFIGFTGYAMAKHQLMDVKVIIQKGLAFSFYWGLIFLLYFILVMVFGLYLGQFAKMTIFGAAGLSIIFGVYGMPVIKDRFIRLTDKFFFKGKYEYSVAVYELCEVLNHNIKLKNLLLKFSEKLRVLLRVEKVLIVLPKLRLVAENDEIRAIKETYPDSIYRARDFGVPEIILHSEIENYLEESHLPEKGRKLLLLAGSLGKKYGVELTVPVLADRDLVGFISLSGKKSGDFFTDEDVSLLKTVSSHAAIAFEKARLYEKVRRHSRDLEKKIEERISEIKDLQEEQKQMMLEIAHGLQTPLTVIKGELSLMKNDGVDPVKTDSLERSVDRISKFIYDMLRLAKLESDGKFKKMEKINLSSFLEELLEVFEVVAGAENIRIKNRIQKNICIRGNRNEIEELLNNLMSNGIKYMGETKNRSIIIELEQIGQEVKLVIEDTGIGIDKKHIKNIFSRFHRINDSSISNRKGTGLGLAICRKIVENHKGEISVESELGRGTKFQVLLPVYSDEGA